MKHIHTFENFLNEGAMSDIDLLAKKTKDFKAFVIAFKKEYSNLDAGNDKELEAWLKTVYDSAKNESFVTEAFNFSLSSNAKAAIDVINAIEKNSKFLKESDMAEMLDTLSAALKKVGYLGLEDYK